MIAQTGWAGPLEGDRVVGMDSTNDTQRKAVDWSKPIEAVHVDGRVRAVELAYNQPDMDGDYKLTEPLEPKMDQAHYFDADGSQVYELDRALGGGRPWKIRNVQTPEAATPAIDPALVERMRNLVQNMAQADKREVAIMGTGQREAYEEARDILKALEPVDGDLLEARRLIIELSGSVNPAWIQNVKDGKHDQDDEGVPIALAAIRRGRALER